MRCGLRILFPSSCMCISSCPNTICWKNIFFHWESFSPFQNSTGHLYLGVFLNPQHYSLPSIQACQSLCQSLCQSHTVLIVSFLIVNIKTGWSDSSNIILCFQISLAVQDLLNFHINFRSGSGHFEAEVFLLCYYGFSYF